MEIKGMKITDIMNMSWDELNNIAKTNPKDFRTLTSRLVSASNKRIRRLEKTKRGIHAPAYASVRARGSKFSVRGKNVNQLKNEFATAKHFLQMKTSTAKGWNRYRTMMEIRTGQFTDGESLNWSDHTWSKYWEIYRKFQEIHGGSFKPGDSERIQQLLTEILDTNDKRKKAKTFEEILEERYAEYYENEDEDDYDIDDYFDLE